MYKFRLLNVTMIFTLLLLAVTSAQAQLAAACADPAYAGSRLVGGAYARVLPGEPNNVRESPSTTAPLIATIEPGQVVYVTSAPTCAEGYVWWQVMYRLPESTEDFPFGYTAEGAAPLGEGNYWLEPAPQPLNVPLATTPISAANAGQLQQVAQVEFGMVNRFMWSADSRHLAINTVGATWVYDLTVADSMPVRFTANPYDTNYTQGLAFGADGDSVATAGSAFIEPNSPMAGAAYLWSLSNPAQPVTTMTLPTSNFAGAAAISADLTRAAFADDAGVIHIWDIASATEVATLTGHTLVGSIAFSPDGTKVVSVGTSGMMTADTTMRLWDAATGTELSMMEMGEMTPMVAFSPDGSTVAVVTFNMPDAATQGVHLIDTTTFAVTGVIAVPTGSIAGISFNADGSLLAISNSYFDDAQGGWASTVRIVDIANQTEVGALPFNSGVGAVSFSPDGTLLAVMYEDPLFWGPNRATLWAVP